MSKLITPEARLSFPNLFVPKAGMDGGEAKYTATLLFPKTADLSALKKAASEAVREKWGDKKPANLRNPFRDGSEKDLDGYADCIFMNVSSKQKPGVVDENVQPVMDAATVYAGCYVRASLTCYAYEKNGNRGVAFGLQNIQKLRDGESFTGRTKPEDDFNAVGASLGPAVGVSGKATAVAAVAAVAARSDTNGDDEGMF